MMEPAPSSSSTAPDTGKLDFWVRQMPPLPGSVNKDPEQMKPGEVPPGPWDPALFKDDDGQWYLYWGSSNVFPMYGQKIAFGDGKLVYQTKPEPMLKLHPDQHGWERFGQDHCACWQPGKPSPSYMEGAWMTKHGGRYYLQYGAPGTEFNVYANGIYVSDIAARSVQLCALQSRRLSPGGFAEGAGHGSTFRDNAGNCWNTGTAGSDTIGAWSGGSSCIRLNSTATASWRYLRGSEIFRIMRPTTKFDDPDKPVHWLDVAILSQTRRRVVDEAGFRHRRGDRRKPANVLGRREQYAGADSDPRSRRAQDSARDSGELR